MPESRQRILVIRLSSIGDIVHALPAVAALGKALPDAEIHWAVESRYAALLDGNPFVHRVVKLDTLAWRRKLTSPAVLKEIVRAIRAIREVRFDAALDFQGLYKSALIARLSGARTRLGFAENWLREPAAGVFYTEHIAPRGRQHVIELNLALVERLGVRHLDRESWQFPLPRNPADDEHVERLLASFGGREFIVVNPGGGWMSKCWAPESYAKLIRRLEPEFAGEILLTGSQNEEEMTQGIIRQSGSSRARSVSTNIVQFIALARRARLFLGGDTGPLHLAAAVRTPIVAIYGPTDPARNGPFSEDDIVLWNREPTTYTRRAQRPTYLPGITVESALEAIGKRLEREHG
jgi:lipopolysaccharide heptosyltransferase I